MELLAFGKTGWGDELFYATLMTIAVAITAMLIGFFFALIFTPLKLSKNKFLNLVGNFYTTVIRGVPELLVIYLFFFGGSGAVMFVASMFGFQGVPDDLKSKLETYWTDVRSQIDNLEQSLAKITRVYHEGVFESGETGLESVNNINSYAYPFINTLCKSTAKLESLEDKVLVQEEYDWRICSSAGLTSEKVYSLILKNLEESTAKRWSHASTIIDSTIPKDEAALLIVNENVLQFHNYN